MRQHRIGRKPNRPSDWEELTDTQKIRYLNKQKKLTASEQKELRFLTQKKKFQGFKEWLDNRREKEKNTDKYQLTQQRKCRAKRGVSSCEQCCRYAHCHQGQPLFSEEQVNGEIRLGQAIILAVEESIERCWRKGWKDQLNYWLKVLADKRTNILTAETVDGYSSCQAIVYQCRKKYGEFEPIYEKCQKTYKPKLAELEKKYDELKKKGRNTDKLAVEISTIIKKLYGDTIV